MLTYYFQNVATKNTRGLPMWRTLRQRGPIQRVARTSFRSSTRILSECPSKYGPQCLRAVVASTAKSEAHMYTAVSLPAEKDVGRSLNRLHSVVGCPSSTKLEMTRLPSILHLGPYCRKCRRAWPVVGNIALPQQLVHARSLSIMDRYNRARSELNWGPVLPTTPPEMDAQQLISPRSPIEPTTTPSAPSSRPFHRPVARDPVPAEALFATWEPPLQPSHPRSLTVALIGPPNAGKSSLLNAFLGVTVSAVSNKVNTTRTDFRGMVTKGNCQLVFVDAPGIIESHPKKSFCRDLVNAAWRGYEDADLGILVIDTVKRPTQQIFNIVRSIAPKPCLSQLGFHHSGLSGIPTFPTRAHETMTGSIACSPSLDEMRKAGIPGTVRHRLAKTHTGGEVDEHTPTIPILLCLNKIDLASHPKWIRAREREFQSHGLFRRVFHVSAKHRRGTESLLDYLISEAVPRSWSFPPEMRTSLSKVQQIEELIRTYLFCWFNKDVPYRISQRTVGWSQQEDGSIAVEQELVVRTAQVAKMICGVRGRILLQMRKNVTYKLEQLWGCIVHLNIFVRVAND